jgi:2-hydroxy-3-keto-5-methylthiopentenyl-1-phosphate phosphatase
VKGPMAVTSQKILVSDFDGTMTQHDFYQLAVESLLPPETPDYWIDYRAGAITHFEALRRYFAAICASEEDVLRVVARMQLDPGLGPAVRALRAAGWDVVVTSAGVDKTKIVQTLLNEGRCVAFAGDGFPDVEPARLVPDDLRFARGDLAKVFQNEGLPFQRYDRWSEIATKLVSRKQS